MEAIADIKHIIEDVRAEKIGAVKTGLEIFNLSVIPFILYNSETWDEIPKDAMKSLDKIQMTFLRTLLKTPISTPKASLLWETGTLSMSALIVMRKLNFYYHIMNLHEDTLAKRFAIIQMRNKFPGLMKEIKEILRKYALDVMEVEDFSKQSWKKMVKQRVSTVEKEDLYQRMTLIKYMMKNFQTTGGIFRVVSR